MLFTFSRFYWTRAGIGGILINKKKRLAAGRNIDTMEEIKQDSVLEQDNGAEEIQAFAMKKFKEQGDFDILPEGVLEKMLSAIVTLDEEYMEKAGVNDGEVYDDDDAYEYFMEKLPGLFPEQKMYIMRFVEDYMEYSEAYLESIGAIDWE